MPSRQEQLSDTTGVHAHRTADIEGYLFGRSKSDGQNYAAVTIPTPSAQTPPTALIRGVPKQAVARRGSACRAGDAFDGRPWKTKRDPESNQLPGQFPDAYGVQLANVSMWFIGMWLGP